MLHVLSANETIENEKETERKIEMINVGMGTETLEVIKKALEEGIEYKQLELEAILRSKTLKRTQHIVEDIKNKRKALTVVKVALEMSRDNDDSTVA